MSSRSRAWLFVIFAAVGVGFAGHSIALIGYYVLGFVAAALIVWWLLERKSSARDWWNDAVNPIVLQSPFTDPWYVSAGGPQWKHNHHLASKDQRFAYDFLPKEGADGGEILAPCDGTVAWTQERGDVAYVSIETPRGFVILAHLEKDSIAVRVADSVHAGMTIAHCAKLHLHAQDRPQMTPDLAQAIPVAFLDERGIAQVLEYGDVLQPAGSGLPA
jgi:hypothetical protein